jgi:hypothetical protein
MLCLGLLITSCERKPAQSEDAVSADSSSTPPAVTKNQRDKPERTVLSGESLRESLIASEKLSSPEEREAAIASLAWDHAEENPSLALEAMDHLAVNRPERERLIEHFAMRFAEQDLDRSILWAQGLKSPEEISIALGRISLVMAATDPSRAAHVISESGMVGRQFDVAVVQIIQRWAARSPAEAAAWVRLFEPSTARTAGIQQTLSLWAKTDGVAAVAWIKSLNNESLRRDATQAMADFILAQPQAMQDEWAGNTTPEIESEILSRKDKSATPPRR